MALGTNFVKYADALDQGHQMGLRGIETDLVREPTEENDHSAIVKATVDMGEGKIFSGFGDATPYEDPKYDPAQGKRGVSPVATATLRMAETRAKARALRDAINLNRPIAGDIEDASGGLTMEQFNKIDDLASNLETLGSVEAFEEAIGQDLASLTEDEARVWIMKLERRLEKQQVPANA